MSAVYDFLTSIDMAAVRLIFGLAFFGGLAVVAWVLLEDIRH